MSPLRHIPGPLIGTLTPAWLFVIDTAGHRARYVHWLHQHYGPVVRIGPAELSFATAAAAHDIYVGGGVAFTDSQAATTGDQNESAATTTVALATMPTNPSKPFRKSAMYDLLGRMATFRMRDHAQHREQLKRVAHIYTPSTLQDMEPLMRGEVALLLAALEKRRGAAVNVQYWFRMMAFDIIGTFS